MANKIFIVINEDRFFLSHRVEIAEEARRLGYEVTLVVKDTGQIGKIADMGFNVVHLPIDPTRMNPIKELNTLAFLYRLYRKNRPDIVHHVGLKNILWGGLAAKLAKVPGVLNAVSGLGGLFNGEKLSMTSRGVLAVMRYNNRRENVKVIFQNNDDKEIFLNAKSVEPSQIHFIKGSGVDLDDYNYTEEPKEDTVKVIFTARMVKEKGVTDLIEAAELLKPEYEGKVEFWLCGRTADNKSAVPEGYLLEHCDGKYINWLGLRSDVKDLLKKCSIMAFPSHYREGVPKSLIEASAIGRPIITCDSVGCRDTVEDGVNGFLIEPRNPAMLAEKLKILIDDRDLRNRMGIKSRKKAEREFDIRSVVDKHMQIYKELSNPSNRL